MSSPTTIYSVASKHMSATPIESITIHDNNFNVTISTLKGDFNAITFGDDILLTDEGYLDYESASCYMYGLFFELNEETEYSKYKKDFFYLVEEFPHIFL